MPPEKTNRILEYIQDDGSYLIHRLVHLREKCREFNKKEQGTHYSVDMGINDEGDFFLRLHQHVDIG